MLKKIMQKANAKKKDQKGFTLIELLAVIVILAILAAIAIPSVISIINKQNNRAAVQDGLTIIHAAKLYVADNNGDASEITKDNLKDYLDSSNLPSGADYSVTKSGSTYTLTYNKLPDDVGTDHVATEQQLLKYNGKNISSTTGAAPETESE